MDDLCRLCGSEEGIRISIFDPGSDHVKKIHKILPITVNEHDPFPKKMCHRCSFKVNEFFEFRTNCIKAQEVFRSKVPWLKDKRITCIDNGHPPMVEVPLNSVNAVSPNEKQITNDSLFIDENNPMIIIEDDSPPYMESSEVSNSIINDCGPQDKIIMKIKRADAKKKSKTRSIWDTKKRKKKSRKSSKFTEVYTPSVDEYQRIDNIENDPLRLSPVDKNENKDSYSYLSISPKNDYNNIENGILTNEIAGQNPSLPKHILITNIPRVGMVYTCEKCGRTFLLPQPASLHVCDDVVCNEDNNRSKKDEQEVSNHTEFYKCKECGQVFTRHSQLVSHQKKHYELDSSSDDNFTPFNHRRKHHTKKKTKPRLLTNHHFLMRLDQREPGITRHSLLSSDSE